MVASNAHRQFRLSRVVSLLESSLFFRHGLFFVASFATIFLSGYYFGTFDQSIHIPFLKKDVDPSLYPNDAFFELRKTHFSYFWYIFHPIYKAGVLEISLFLAHFFATYLTFWAIWRLCMTLFKNATTAFFVVLALIFPHLGFAAFPIFEFSLLNRTFVFPFLIISIDWYLKKQYLKSFVLLGLLYNLHALSVNFVLFMFIADLVIQFFQGRLRGSKGTLALSFFLLFISALPVLAWKFGKSPIDWTLRPEWFHILSNSFMYTVFYPLSTSPSVLLITASGISAFLLYFLQKNLSSLSPYVRVISHFMYAAIAFICLEVAVSLWFPVTVLVQFQIIRIGIFVLLFGYLFFMHSLVKQYQENRLQRSLFIMQFFSVFFSPTPLVPLFVDLLTRSSLFKKIRLFAGWVLVAVSFIFFAWFALSTDVWRPGIEIFPQRSDWYMAQVWAKENTPKDALFITPPEKWWLFEPDWRVFSERSTLVTLSEVLEFAFTPEYTESWKERFEVAAPGALGQFRGDLHESKLITKQAYERLSDEELQAVATKYRVSYIVVAKPRVLLFPLVYQNGSFAIYKLPAFYAVSPQKQGLLTSVKIFPTIQ